MQLAQKMEVTEQKGLPARTSYPLHPLLARRFSPVAFSPRPVESEKLRSLFEAARWAPSSYNEQPWSFIVARRENPEDFARLLSTLAEGNVPWAQQAPVLILSIAKINFQRTGGPNRHALHDVGQAVADLTVQATALDLYVHQMAGFDVEKARQLLNLPPGYEPVAMMAVGYLGNSEGLPEALRRRQNAPRTRKPLEEFVFTGSWGQPSVAAL